jgi:hypothetical protein
MTSVRKRLAPAFDGEIARISDGRSLLLYGENQFLAVGQLADSRDDRHWVPSPFVMVCGPVASLESKCGASDCFAETLALRAMRSFDCL